PAIHPLPLPAALPISHLRSRRPFASRPPRDRTFLLRMILGPFCSGTPSSALFRPSFSHSFRSLWFIFFSGAWRTGAGEENKPQRDRKSTRLNSSHVKT